MLTKKLCQLIGNHTDIISTNSLADQAIAKLNLPNVLPCCLTLSLNSSVILLSLPLNDFSLQTSFMRHKRTLTKDEYDRNHCKPFTLQRGGEEN
jgi:hypothetical protein